MDGEEVGLLGVEGGSWGPTRDQVNVKGLSLKRFVSASQETKRPSPCPTSTIAPVIPLFHERRGWRGMGGGCGEVVLQFERVTSLKH